MTITYQTGGSSSAAQEEYEYQLLKLALDKTEPEYGPYILTPSQPMNSQRAALEASKNAIEHFVFRSNYSSRDDKTNLRYIPIPVDLGALGFRICFTSSIKTKPLAKIENIEQLRKRSFGFPPSWHDSEILKHNGFRVFDILSIKSMYMMVANGRFDYLCLGINEVYSEWKNNKHINNLTIDNSFVLYYDLPRFFYLNTQNTTLATRLRDGLDKAYYDGSMHKLWLTLFKEPITFANIETRQLFYLENPFIADISPDYDYYFMNPFDFRGGN